MKHILLTLLTIGLLLNCEIAHGQDRATPPYSTSFESDNPYGFILDSEWTNYWEQNAYPGFNEIIDSDAYDGEYSLKMWADISSGLVIGTHDATLRLDLSSGNQFFLRCNWKAIYIETSNGADCLLQLSDFIGEEENLPEEERGGIFISDNNGVSYVKVFSFGNNYGSWNSLILSLHTLATQYGLLLNDQFMVKFQYFCVYGSDQFNACDYDKHLILDNVSLESLPSDDLGGDLNYEVVYSYDQAGNRTGRDYVLIPLKSATLNQGFQEPFVDTFEEKEIRIYPNPTKGSLKINISGKGEEFSYYYFLYDMRGGKIQSGTFNNGYGEHSIEMGKYNTGMYVLILQGTDDKLTFKILKE